MSKGCKNKFKKKLKKSLSLRKRVVDLHPLREKPKGFKVVKVHEKFGLQVLKIRIKKTYFFLF